MSRLLLALVFLISHLYTNAAKPGSQGAATTVDEVIAEVLARYGSVADAGNFQLLGQISYRNQPSHAFTLTLEKTYSRLEVANPAEQTTIIRRDSASQSIRAGKMDPPTRARISEAGLNFVPIAALIRFKNDRVYSRKLVTGSDNSQGIRFVEGVPPGFQPSPLQRKTTVTFWLDSSRRITSLTFVESEASASRTYVFGYEQSVTAPFLQPNTVIGFFGPSQALSLQVSAATKNVLIPAGFFDFSR
ncbi:MAG TPA: hypothetical protein VGJ48_27240 [Pyrinomonadaceae bacterium]|jgi:hypothetical protein